MAPADATKTTANTEAQPDDKPGDAPEPPAATHGAEDETWETDGHDTAHLEDKATELEARIDELEGELAAAKERTLRARADYENLAKRVDRERDDMVARAAARVVERLLEPLETLSRATADVKDPDDPIIKGLRLAHDQLLAAARAEGLDEVAGVGAAFDHHVHEAIAREPSEHPEGQVLEVIRPGYTVNGKLLRAAMVKVSAGPDTTGNDPA